MQALIQEDAETMGMPASAARIALSVRRRGSTTDLSLSCSSMLINSNVVVLALNPDVTLSWTCPFVDLRLRLDNSCESNSDRFEVATVTTLLVKAASNRAS